MRRPVLLSLALALAACDESEAWHEMNPTLARMMHQRRGTPYGETAAFADGRVMRAPPPGTVPRAPPEPAYVTNGQYVDRIPIEVTRATLDLGRARFETTCAACHGVLGDGDSIVATKMESRKPRSLQEDAVRVFRVGQLYEVIVRGYGLMPAYTLQLSTPEERWAVVAYVKALELSQNAPVQELPEDLRAELARQAP